MKIHRKFGCTGLAIALPGPWQLEVWFCPPGTVIPMHVHDRIQSFLVFLGGRMIWWKDNLAGRQFTWRDIGRGFLVKPNRRHGALTVTWGLFANLERWSGPKTSASIDIA